MVDFRRELSRNRFCRICWVQVKCLSRVKPKNRTLEDDEIILLFRHTSGIVPRLYSFIYIYQFLYSILLNYVRMII